MTPRAKSCSNRRPRIIASAMSWTANSSKQRRSISAASSRATGAIGSPPFAPPFFGSRAERGDAVVHLAHELVEVDAALPRRRRGGEEEIHEQRLAAPDAAPDVEAARRRRARADRPQPGERSASPPRAAAGERDRRARRARRRARPESRPARSRRTAPSPRSAASRSHACGVFDLDERRRRRRRAELRRCKHRAGRQRETVTGPPPSVWPLNCVFDAG